MNTQIQVSVICATYNHRPYIENALKGFVAQQTNFKFEVLVHDDASTDGTDEVVREYERQYPDLIRGIYSTENQLSKGLVETGFGTLTHIFIPRAKGRYFAFCEGDDYWIDPYKLQKQYDFMEDNPEYSMCFHRAIQHVHKGAGWERPVLKIYPRQDSDKDYSLEEILIPTATASIFLRSELYRAMPDCFLAAAEDYPLKIYMAISGKCRCLQDVMSVYNYMTVGSATESNEQNKFRRVEVNQSYLEMLKRVDKFYDYRYTDVLTRRMRYHEYHIYKHLGKWEKIQTKEYEEFRQKDRDRTILKDFWTRLNSTEK